MMHKSHFVITPTQSGSPLKSPLKHWIRQNQNILPQGFYEEGDTSHIIRRKLSQIGWQLIFSEDAVFIVKPDESNKFEYADSFLENIKNQNAAGVMEPVNEPISFSRSRKYWLIAPGESASWWNEFYDSGIIGIGWNDMGDLHQFKSREEVQEKLHAVFPEHKGNHTHSSLCLWQFCNEIAQGDIIIAKRGITEYIGYGIVCGDYDFDEQRKDGKHIRKVDWKKKGRWEARAHKIVTKTLTDITKYPDYVDLLKRLIGIEQEVSIDESKIEYYWLNANPRFWKIEDCELGDEQSYTTHNENGNKRSRFEYFQKIKPCDLMIGYETTPTKKVIALFEVTRGAHIDEDDGKEKISFKIQKFLPEPISYETLKGMKELEESEVMKNNQGSLFKLTYDEFNSIISLDISSETNVPEYSISDAEEELFLPREKIEEIERTLEYKRNIILQGPPGVGKTFMAKRIAFLAMEAMDRTKIEMIQFHQSYSYEDFIQGYRPKPEGGFKLESGIFYRFCKKAHSDPANKYFFIIDEINRGNLSKIFGELMLLIERDKRGPEHAVSLTYSPSNDTKFFIPENVYIIGTMNTADRSLAVVDYALRRRFSFIDINPVFDKKFAEEMKRVGVEIQIIDSIIQKFGFLNSVIEKDSSLGREFAIGHSYFCNVPEGSGDVGWYNKIVKYEIGPLLEEYWFDDRTKAREHIARLYL